MTNYFLISIYLLSILTIFVAPLYLKVQTNRLFVLSILPLFLVASATFLTMLISYFFDDKSFTSVLMLSIFIFFMFLIFGYILMLPILILVAFIVEYLKIYYHYPPIILSFTGGILGATVVGIIYMKWEFIWIALVSGFSAVLIQYYFAEHKKEE